MRDASIRDDNHSTRTNLELDRMDGQLNSIQRLDQWCEPTDMMPPYFLAQAVNLHKDNIGDTFSGYRKLEDTLEIGLFAGEDVQIA